MRDNPLVTAVRETLVEIFNSRSVPAQVLQAYQPTQQGLQSGDVVYFQHLPMDRRYGWPQMVDRWNEDDQQFEHVESQQMESTFQFTATAAEQDPASGTQWTPGDFIKAAAAALQSDLALEKLRARGVGVERVTTIRIGYPESDRGQFEQSPSFDVTFTHRDETLDIRKPIEATELLINRV